MTYDKTLERYQMDRYLAKQLDLAGRLYDRKCYEFNQTSWFRPWRKFRAFVRGFVAGAVFYHVMEIYQEFQE